MGTLLQRSLLFAFVCELDFHEPVYGARNAKLEHCPFDQDLSDVTEFPALPLSNAFEFTAQVLSDSQAYLSFPLAHLSHRSQASRPE